MARKNYTGINQFKKYRDNSKKSEAFRKKVHRKAVSNLKKISRQKNSARKKRMNAYKQEANKTKSTKAIVNSVSATLTEKESQRKGCTLFIVLGLIFLAILFFAIGPVGILIIGGISISIFITYIVYKIKKDAVKSRNLSQEEIDKLQQHLTNIDIYKNVANTSSDEHAVQYAMDKLLQSIDFIMSYEEEELHQAGMSKEKLPRQREFILQHYNDMIAQAREQSAENRKNF